MAILKSVVNVNNGNTGWTRQDVLDALETTFANLGWNGGSAIAGSPVAFVAPGATASVTLGASNFQYCGGPAIAIVPVKTRYFYVTNNDTSSYNLLEQFVAASWNTTNDTVTFTRHGLQTGDPLVYNPYNFATNLVNFVGYTTGQTYYVIRVDNNIIKLALTAEDASNAIAVDLTSATGSPGGYIMFRRGFDVLYNNYTIDVLQGDTLNFSIDDTTSGGDFFLIDSPTTGYAANRVLRSSNMQFQSYMAAPTNSGSGASGAVNWETAGWYQTETENGNPQDTNPNRPGEIRRYGYGNSTNPAMRGEIRLLPSNQNSYNSYSIPYYKYTVPASGSRSELKLRVSRNTVTYGSTGIVRSIRITSIGSGWGENETFTIPGSAIGGVDGTNDILVGVNSLTAGQQTARTGVCNLLVTNYGAGSNMYQKSGSGHFAVLKNVNDAAKTYGTTYYGFGMDANNYRMYLNSGPSWQTLDRRGTNHLSTNAAREYGYYYGEIGLDYQPSSNYITQTDASVTYLDYASTSTPTAYPLSIRSYKAQSPQDTNFAVIQFTQTINNVIVPYATFSLHKGPSVGANVWDLNHVWNGGLTTYSIPSARGIRMSYLVAGNIIWQADMQDEIPSENTLAREANYGYLRNGSNQYNISFPYTTYECNIDTDNSFYYNNIITYYRNSTYDTYSSTDNANGINYFDRTRSVSASANYYKPMKGLPISTSLMPCPYYLPDDYVMLQVATSPGLTQFRPGDTVTVSAGEVYDIIVAGYQTQQNGLDNVANNQSIGILFCARTT